VQEIFAGIDMTEFNKQECKTELDHYDYRVLVSSDSLTRFTKYFYMLAGRREVSTYQFEGVGAKIDFKKAPRREGKFQFARGGDPVPQFMYPLEETQSGLFDELANLCLTLAPEARPRNREATQQKLRAQFPLMRKTFKTGFFYSTGVFAKMAADTANARVSHVVTDAGLRIGYSENDPKRDFVGFGGATVKINTVVRFAVHPPPTVRWLAWRTSQKSSDGSKEPRVQVRRIAGALMPQPPAKEPETNWRVVTIIPGSSIEFLVDCPQGGELRRSTIEVLELDRSNCRLFPEVLPPDLTAEAKNGLISYVASLQRALEPKGWLLEAADENPSLSAARSLARLNLLDIARRVADERFPTMETPQAPWRQRRAFLDQALPIAAREVFVYYRPKLEAELSASEKQLRRLREVYATLQRGIRDYNMLSQDERWQLLARNEVTLQIDAPYLKESQDSLKAALFGASEAIFEDIQRTEARRLLAADMLTRLAFEGNDVFPAFKSNSAPDVVTASGS
jgi:hypothetical protein